MRQNAVIIVMLGNPRTSFGAKLWIMPLVFFSVKNSGGTEEPLCCGVIAPSVIWLYSYIQSSTDSQHGFF